MANRANYTSAEYQAQNPNDRKAQATGDFTYTASRFETDKYNVKGLSYPEDLMNDKENRYGGNRVIFYINASVDSRIFKSGSNVTTVTGVQRDMRSQLTGQKITEAQATTAATASGALAGAIGGSIFAGSGSGGAIVGGAVGAGGAKLVANNANNAEVPPGQEKEPTFSRPQKRLEAAIALYIPNQLSARYSAQWGEEDTAGFSALSKGAGEIGRALEGDGSAARTGGLAGEVLTALALDKGPMGKEMGIAAGLAANPKKEQAFKNVDFRTFNFEYNFAPRTETEAENVMAIIRAFKYHMHPEFKSSDAFLYIYPSEFDIAYYKGAGENLYIHRHTSCVLTECNVNYTPNGVFSTFPNGMPTSINLSLTFKELMLLSKETIEKYT